MSRPHRRLYSVLGVEPGVDDVTLRRAYKQLITVDPVLEAPGDPDVAARLAAASHAYEVLRDRGRRALYDEFGDRSLKKGFDPEAARRRAEAEKRAAQRRAMAALALPTAFIRKDGAGATDRKDWEVQIGIGRRLAKSGGLLRLPVTRPVTCPRCDGDRHTEKTCTTCRGCRTVEGRKVESCTTCRGLGLTGSWVKCAGCAGSGNAKRGPKACRRCDGAGTVVRRTDCSACRGKGQRVTPLEKTCDACQGAGYVPCTRCAGTGKIRKALSLRLRVPRGAQAECLYRYAGAGFSEGEAPSDLVVRFAILARSPRR